MLVETTMKYYDKKYDLNCAECILELQMKNMI